MNSLPRGWRQATLGEIAQISTGGTPDRQQPLYWGGDVPWVSTSEVRFNTITDTAERITREGLRHSSAKWLPAGTLLLAMYGQGRTRGQVARLGIEAATNQACAAIQAGGEADAGYLYQYLACNYEAVRDMGNTGTQRNLSMAIVKRIPLPLPPLAEQAAIARMAATWDEAIATSQRLLSNRQQQKRHLMMLLLSGPHRRGEADAGWNEVDLGEVFQRITQRNTDGNRNVLTISGQYGLVSQRDYFTKGVASEDLSDYIHLSTGDFAYNKSASSGYPMGAIKPLVAHDAGVVSRLYICFRQRPEVQVDADFYRQYFEAGMLNEALGAIAKEGARSHGLLNVSVKDFFKLPLRLPPLDVQRQIADILRVAEAGEHAVTAQLDALRAEKLALMHDVLRGRRRLGQRARTTGAPAA